MEDLMSVVKLFLQLFGTNDAIPTTLDSSLLNQLEAFFQNEGTRELASSFKVDSSNLISFLKSLGTALLFREFREGKIRALRRIGVRIWACNRFSTN